MRVLAIDLGSKRIGTAVSDALGITVRPVETIRRSNARLDIARLRSLAEELEAEAVVVGLPLKLDGTAGDAAQATMQFVDRLQGEIRVPVFMQDERLTSYEAEEIMIELGLKREERRARSDQYAAMIILQDYLSRTRAKH
jgi:putative holliday junction resolvase